MDYFSLISDYMIHFQLHRTLLKAWCSCALCLCNLQPQLCFILSALPLIFPHTSIINCGNQLFKHTNKTLYHYYKLATLQTKTKRYLGELHLHVGKHMKKTNYSIPQPTVCQTLLIPSTWSLLISQQREERQVLFGRNSTKDKYKQQRSIVGGLSFKNCHEKLSIYRFF